MFKCLWNVCFCRRMSRGLITSGSLHACNVHNAYTYQMPSPSWLSRSEGLHKASSSESGRCSRKYRGRIMRTFLTTKTFLKKTKVCKRLNKTLLIETLPYIQYKAHYWVWALMCPIYAGSPSESGTRERLGGQTEARQHRRRRCQTSRDLQRSQNEFTRLQLVLNHYITVCWMMDCVFLTNRFSITLTSSLTWLRIFLQHSALCWILSFSVGSSVEQQKTQRWQKQLSPQSPNKSNKSCVPTKVLDGQQSIALSVLLVCLS